MNSSSPTLPYERIEILDVLRGIAIFGILIGNLQWFSGYGFMPSSLVKASPAIDQAIRFLVHFFVEGKFYSVFSFLFGVGFAIQISKADERGDTTASVFKRRLFWLLVIGLLHAYFLWYGDILSVYALMGFALILFRRKSTTSMLKWAAALLVIPVVTYALMLILFKALAPSDVQGSIDSMQADMWSSALARVPESGYFQIYSGFNLQMIVGRYAGLILDMRLPKILAMFLLGVCAHKKGIFSDLGGHVTVIRRVLVYGLVFGLAGNILFATFAGSEAPIPPSAAGLLGVFAYAFGVPALALFYVAALASLWRKEIWQRLLGLLAPVGRMALTNYLMHTVICVLIFYGFGLGQFGQVDAGVATLIALPIFVIQIMASGLWLKNFNYGPVEWIWRQLTYRKRLPIKRLIPNPQS